jgi:parvulin-like peptidyl-prolyl isomerase
VIGVLLFGTYSWLNRDVTDETDVVHLTESELNWLVETWSRQWNRTPDRNELREMATDYLREVLLEREARQLGLDVNDTVVRRRLAQKMEFLIHDAARLGEPGEAGLRALYDADLARYTLPPQISFVQIYFKTEDAARQGLEGIEAADFERLGDPSLLLREFVTEEEDEIASQLGPEFAAALAQLDLGVWHGPIASTYGYHLVRVSERIESAPMPFELVQDRVVEEWHQLARQQADEQLLAGLAKKYDIVLDDGVKAIVGPLGESTP